MRGFQIYKRNLLWSAASGAVAFAMLYAWMLYYAATATSSTSAHPRILGMPIFTVNGIPHGFEIGPDFGILVVPVICCLFVFVVSAVLQRFGERLTSRLPS